MFAAGATGKALHDTTTGGLDVADLGCADTSAEGGSPERWFELTVPGDNTVELQLAATFDAALELRSGACDADPPRAVGCAQGHDGRIEGAAVTEGSWCVVVDGVSEDGLGRSGGFDLFVRFAEPPVPACEPDCEVEDPFAEPGVVNCGGAWAGTHVATRAAASTSPFAAMARRTATEPTCTAVRVLGRHATRRARAPSSVTRTRIAPVAAPRARSNSSGRSTSASRTPAQTAWTDPTTCSGTGEHPARGRRTARQRGSAHDQRVEAPGRRDFRQ